MTCTQNIFAVWKAGSEQDAWILHRSLLDRLLHLHHLNETNGFSDFEDYSFLSMYKARHQLLSDPDMTSKAPPGMKELQKSNKARYDEIAAKRSRWQRPKPEEVAKKMDLGFLYRFGYDYASTHVHPMAGNGERDFTTLVSPPHALIPPDATVVLELNPRSNHARPRSIECQQDALARHRVRLLGSGSCVSPNRRPAVSYHVLQDWPGVARYPTL